MPSVMPSRSPNLYLVRHGESTLNAAGVKYGLLDPPLTPTGTAQAHDTAARLDGIAAAIICSPLRRAHEYALLLARLLGLPAPTVHDELTERSFGMAEGLTPALIARDYPHGVPLAESPDTVAARARPVLEALTAPTIVVTHQGVIKGLTGEGLPNGGVTVWRPDMPKPAPLHE